MSGSGADRPDTGGSNGSNNDAGVYSQGQGQESSPTLGVDHEWLSCSDWGKQQMEVSGFFFSSRADLEG